VVVGVTDIILVTFTLVTVVKVVAVVVHPHILGTVLQKVMVIRTV
tara:strand:+ start:647 stop:781 length:135 start_codon:yes stop_codon:yes gene_type:complete